MLEEFKGIHAVLGYTQVSDLGIGALSSCKRLRLVLMRNTTVSLAGISAAVAGLPALESLDLASVDNHERLISNMRYNREEEGSSDEDEPPEDAGDLATAWNDLARNVHARGGGLRSLTLYGCTISRCSECQSNMPVEHEAALAEVLHRANCGCSECRQCELAEQRLQRTRLQMAIGMGASVSDSLL